MDSKAVVEETREVKDIVNLFPGAVNKAKLAFNRPHSKNNVLIGMASRSLHCKDGLEVGKMRLNKSMFSPECALTGSIISPQADKGQEDTASTKAKQKSTNNA